MRIALFGSILPVMLFQQRQVSAALFFVLPLGGLIGHPRYGA